MTEPEDSMNRSVGLVFLIAIFVVGVAVYFIFAPPNRFDVSNIPDQERWNDLNNHAARDRFCQARGYTEARITEGYGERDDAGSPYGYYILCKRSVPEKQTYDYSEYKKWLIQLEITNKT